MNGLGSVVSKFLMQTIVPKARSILIGNHLVVTFCPILLSLINRRDVTMFCVENIPDISNVETDFDCVMKDFARFNMQIFFGCYRLWLEITYESRFRIYKAVKPLNTSKIKSDIF